MTAEIAILNKSGIALAADSAVTVDLGSGYKVYQSANKLFTLSKYHPVGLMIFGRATFMGVDWETAVKVYRNDLGPKAFSTLREYASDFLRFLQDHRQLFDKEAQAEFVKQVIRTEFISLRRTVVSRIEATIVESGRVDESEVVGYLREVVDTRFLEVRSCTPLKLVDGSELPAERNAEVRQSHRSIVAQLKKDVFQELPLSSSISRKLSLIAEHIFTKQIFSQTTPGVVIAGYGKDDFFPVVEGFDVEGIFCNTLQFRRRTLAQAGKNGAAIIPFAQTEMVHSFMEGVDEMYQHNVENLISASFETYTEEMLDTLNLSTRQREACKVVMIKAREKRVGEMKREMKYFRSHYFSQPVVQTVAALPKSELAAMAEALVNLTSFRQRVTPDTETVGGPIDVAVISRGDGFVWIKRKHYFDPRLNHHFFSNYYREDGSEE